MELQFFTNLIDALGKMAGRLKTIINLLKAERETMRRTLDEIYRMINTTLDRVDGPLERHVNMTEYNLFYYPYASFTNAQLPLLKVVVLYFDRPVILDPVGANWVTIGADHYASGGCQAAAGCGRMSWRRMNRGQILDEIYLIIGTTSNRNIVRPCNTLL